MGFVSKKISPKEEERICGLFLRRFRIRDEVTQGYYDEETSAIYEADASTGRLTGRVVTNVRGPAHSLSASVPAQISAQFSLPLFKSGLAAMEKALREGDAEAGKDMETYVAAVRTCADVSLEAVSTKIHQATKMDSG